MNILDVAGLHCTSFGRWQETDDTTGAHADAGDLQEPGAGTGNGEALNKNGGMWARDCE